MQPCPALSASRPSRPAPATPAWICRTCRQRAAGPARPRKTCRTLSYGRPRSAGPSPCPAHRTAGQPRGLDGRRQRSAAAHGGPARRVRRCRLRALPALRLGEAAGQLADVTDADQPAHGGVTRWRQCPVIAGCAAAPDPPPRVPAPELLKPGILVVPAAPGVHRGRRPAAGRPRCRGRRAGAWMAAGAMLGTPRGGICGAGEPAVRRIRVPAVRRDPSGHPVTSPRIAAERPHAAPPAATPPPGRVPPLRSRVRATRRPGPGHGPCRHASPAAPPGEGAARRSCLAAGSSCPPPGRPGTANLGISP